MRRTDPARHEGRSQYILDLSRDDVLQYLIEIFKGVFSSANIQYIKWDMNRNMTDIYSVKLPNDRQGEVAHRYILGLYRLMEELTQSFPNILFEGCSGGAGRNDPGILYYMPQNWGSDDTDAVERLDIQYGASMVYPASSLCSHVSDVPNHQVGRVTPLKMRGDVAMSGMLGYEFDLSKLNDEDTKAITEQISTYKRIRKIICMSNEYRLLNPFETRSAGWIFVSDDKSEAVAFYFNKLAKPNSELRRMKLRGLDSEKVYIIDDKEYTGKTLMNYGLYLPMYEKDFESKVWEIHEK
ncbi:MAG: alpha-galactosidase [Oscillospiraceae bacterium]